MLNSTLSQKGDRCLPPAYNCFTVMGLSASSPWAGRVAFSTKAQIEQMSERELYDAFQAEYIVAVDVEPDEGLGSFEAAPSVGETVRGQSIGF